MNKKLNNNIRTEIETNGGTVKMKRILSIILVLMMVYGMSISAHAETADETKQTISFRGIPWGSSPDAALETLEEQFGKDSIKVKPVENSYKYRQDDDDKSEKILIPMLLYSVEIENCTVAGYDVESIYLYFIPELSEDGQSYDLSETAGKFWYGEYRLLCPKSLSKSDMHADLSEKIETLYNDTATQGTKTLTISSSGMTADGNGNFKITHSTRNCNHLIWWDESSRLQMCQKPESGINLIYTCDFDRYSSEAMAIKKLIDQKGKAAKQAEQKKRIEDAVGTGTDGL